MSDKNENILSVGVSETPNDYSYLLNQNYGSYTVPHYSEFITKNFNIDKLQGENSVEGGINNTNDYQSSNQSNNYSESNNVYRTVRSEPTYAIKVAKPIIRSVDNGLTESLNKIDSPLNRKIVYIHGTGAGPDRWYNNPETIEMYNRIFINNKGQSQNNTYTPENLYPNSSSYLFDWSTNREQGLDNSYFNDIDNRRDASKKLVANLSEWNDMSNFDEIVLIAHSHGGNVAIQAANELAKIFKKVIIVTYGTPAMNEKYITYTNGSQFNQYAFTPAMVPIKNGTSYYNKKGELNRENPENISDKSNVIHYAVYTDSDNIDNFSHVLETNRPKYGMNNLTSHYKDNGVTVNLKVNRIDKDKLINDVDNSNRPYWEKKRERRSIKYFGNHSGDIYNVQEIERALLDALTDKKNESNIND